LKDRKKYLHLGLMLFFTACAILVFYDTFYKGGTLQRFMTKLVDIIAPVLYGFVMAYLLAPIVNWLERVLTGGAGRAPEGRAKRTA
jgi:predicted PurR-regulated permease PerM